jgi:hypothetical protein
MSGSGWRCGFSAAPPSSILGPMMRFDPTSERWRYDVRLFLLAYVLGIIAFSAVIP